MSRFRGDIALVLLAVALVMTWPTARLWSPELPVSPDASFNVWRLAWIAHQLPADPAALFDANIFYPSTLTLAYSDAMLLVGLMGAPLIWLGVHPFAAHNLLLVAAFWTASLATYLLCRRVTRHEGAAMIGAIIGGYAPYRFGHFGHLELVWTAFIPLALLALITLWEHPSPAAAVRLAACHALQTLCSIYYGVFLAIALVVVASVLAIRDRDRLRSRLLCFAGAVLLTGMALAPYAAIYARVRTVLPARSPAEIATYSARPSDYLRASYEQERTPDNRVEAFEERALYPGAVAVALAIVGVVARSRHAAPMAVLLVASVDLSLGTNGILYPWLLSVFPPLSGLRAPARFGAIVITSLAVLSAGGAVRVLAGRSSLAWLAVLGALLFEYFAAPMEMRREPTTPPPVYAWLAEQADAAVIELPLPAPDALWGSETDFQLMSIYHWKRLVNGYSGHAPVGYIRLLHAMRDFPSSRGMDALAARGVRWLIVHEGLIEPATRTAFIESLLRRRELKPIGSYDDPWGQASIFELVDDNSVTSRRNSSRPMAPGAGSR
jgi:hypothetical protein